MLKCDRARLEMIRRIQIDLSIDDLDMICINCNTESLSRYDTYFWMMIGFFCLRTEVTGFYLDDCGIEMTRKLASRK